MLQSWLICPTHASILAQCGVLIRKRKRLSLLSLLAELLNRDAIHIHDTLLCKALSHGDTGTVLRLVSSLTNEVGLLELLETVADVLSSSLSGDFFSDTTACSATVVLAETLDADLLSHVELVADRCCAGVNPVVIKWVKLLVAGSLNCDCPIGDLELVNLLQMLSENL